MSVFQYTAKDKQAETVRGEIVADTQDEAIEKISQQGLIPVKVSEAGAAESLRKSGRLDSAVLSSATVGAGSGRVRGKDLYMFSRQLAGLLKAGIPLLRALEILQQQMPGVNLRTVVSHLILEIKNGKSLADSLNMHRSVFSPLYVAMIRAGEESGQLRQMLLNLASYQRDQEEIRSKVRTALAYPLIMAFLGVTTIGFMLTYVMPRMSHLFEDMNSLPLATEILLKLSTFMKVAWLPLLAAVLLFFVVLRQWARSPFGQLSLSRSALTLPLFGKFMVKVQVARFARSMELLLKSGMSILQALKFSIPMVENHVVRSELEAAHSDLIAGQSFGRSLKKAPSIPGLIGDLIEVGEESGSLGETLKDVADEYERDVNETIKVMTTLLEPLMIIVVGSIIGFIVMAMLLPIFQLDIYAR